jgi:hypothetical protein
VHSFSNGIVLSISSAEEDLSSVDEAHKLICLVSSYVIKFYSYSGLVRPESWGGGLLICAIRCVRSLFLYILTVHPLYALHRIFQCANMSDDLDNSEGGIYVDTLGHYLKIHRYIHTSRLH